MSAPENIKKLVLRFSQNVSQYKSKLYNETETRIEFLNPFWRELGWDIDNTAGYALNYRDVIHEDCIKLRGGRDTNSKVPDYAFRIGGNRKFFLEAKKPSVDIRMDYSPAYQLRCYGWSCGLALSVLSDFEEFAVYDCRIRPKNTDRADTARIKYLKYDQYVDQWDEIAEIFHRESILRGSFDRFVESRKSKTGTSEVDDEFLKEIEGWRLILARDLAKYNPTLDVRTLNFAVQRTIDRLIFLRMAEDRGMEPEEQLWNLIQKPGIYSQMLDIYRSADEKYNSGFFHFSNENDETEAPDTLTPRLIISDRVLSTILKSIYPPVSPYRFDVLPVEILGNVYERFLGNIIRMTPARQVKVEEKLEVKKANGVYYTPPYIVDYIVQNTIGKQCEGKTPREISLLKIIDPACGSGSFLLGAYKYLMNWHLKYYIADMEQTGIIPQSPPLVGSRKKKSDPYALCQTSSGEWRLTLSERKRILLNNIYGVDLDVQAVEVTKLSLSLCVLEGFNEEVLNANRRLFYDRALPNLSQNIRCGNSLIGTDYFDIQTLFSPDLLEEQYTINAFDWNDSRTGFGDIISEGGFDAVIGNPPYSYLIDEKSRRYYQKTFKHQDYQQDLYLLFLEKYHHLLKKGGLLGVIVSNTWLLSLTYQKIRQHMRMEYSWKKILLLPEKVFDACVDTLVLIYEHTTPLVNDVIEIEQYSKKSNTFSFLHSLSSSLIPSDGSPVNVMANSQKQELYTRIIKSYPSLATIVSVYNGVKPFEKGKGTPPQTETTMKEKPFVKEGKKPAEEWKPLLRGKLIQRYTNLWRENYWIKYGPWLAAPRDPAIFEAPEKIVIRQTSDSLIATLIDGGSILRNNLHIIYSHIPLPINLKYLLGIINSKFMNFIYGIMNPEKGESLAEVKKKHVEQLPIRIIDFSNTNDVKLYETLVQCVDNMLKVKQQLQTKEFVNPRERELLERQATTLDLRIDQIVYTLYGLTNDEIRLCENNCTFPDF